MKNIAMTLILVGIIGIAQAAPDQRQCEMIGVLAKSIAENRDKGMVYKAQLGLLKGATEGQPRLREIHKTALGMAKMIYIDMPRLTPEGAFKLYYVTCMSQK